MPFSIIRDDLAHVRADMVVLPSNEQLVIDGGSALQVAKVAGRWRLKRALKRIGGCPTAHAVVTPAFAFPAKYLVHAVGPVWHDDEESRRLLRQTYDAALGCVEDYGCESIALPLLSAGVRGCPPEESYAIALEAIREYLEQHDIQVTLVLFDRRAVLAGRVDFPELESYIDDAYAGAFGNRSYASRRFDGAAGYGAAPAAAPRYDAAPSYNAPEPSYRVPEPDYDAAMPSHSAPAPVPKQAPDTTASFEAVTLGSAASIPAAVLSESSLKQQLEQLDAGFSETLLKLIDAKGLADVQVYKRANMSRQLFSKIRSDAAYRPTKKTALALCIALRLNLAETQDLLSRAGYTLSHSSKADVIVEYFITHARWDIFAINEALFAFDQQLL